MEDTLFKITLAKFAKSNTDLKIIRIGQKFENNKSMVLVNIKTIKMRIRLLKMVLSITLPKVNDIRSMIKRKNFD